MKPALTVTRKPALFPCPVCGVGLEIRNTKKHKPYVICDPCGVQLFIRNETGMGRFERLLAGAEQRDIWARLEELQHRYHKKCPKCGNRFWIHPDHIKTSWVDGNFEGYRCPERGCDGVAKWKEEGKKYEADGLGTITSLSGPTGTITDAYSYDSFGNITNSTGTTANSFRYMGRDFETEVGLYNFRSRYYVPSTGRFLEEDTIRFRGGPDFYVFVQNDPVRYNDPLGELSGDCQPWLFHNNGASPISGSETPMDGSKKPYNCMAWALGITNDWVQTLTGYFPNEKPPQYGCKIVDCDDKTPNCKKKHRVNVYEDPVDYKNWHVERQNCDGSWSSKNGQSLLWIGINDPDVFYECQYRPKGPAKKTCWLCPGK